MHQPLAAKQSQATVHYGFVKKVEQKNDPYSAHGAEIICMTNARGTAHLLSQSQSQPQPQACDVLPARPWGPLAFGGGVCKCLKIGEARTSGDRERAERERTDGDY